MQHTTGAAVDTGDKVTIVLLQVYNYKTSYKPTFCFRACTLSFSLWYNSL